MPPWLGKVDKRSQGKNRYIADNLKKGGGPIGGLWQRPSLFLIVLEPWRHNDRLDFVCPVLFYERTTGRFAAGVFEMR